MEQVSGVSIDKRRLQYLSNSQLWSWSAHYGGSVENKAAMFDRDRRRCVTLLRRSTNVDDGAASAAVFAQRFTADSAARPCLQET